MKHLTTQGHLQSPTTPQFLRQVTPLLPEGTYARSQYSPT